MGRSAHLSTVSEAIAAAPSWIKGTLLQTRHRGRNEPGAKKERAGRNALPAPYFVLEMSTLEAADQSDTPLSIPAREGQERATEKRVRVSKSRAGDDRIFVKHVLTP